MAIRYDGNLNSKISKVVSSFNRKVRRLKAKDALYLPDTTSVRELKSSFDKRRDLLRELERLSSFTKRGAEKIVRTEGGAKMTKWEQQNLKRDVRVAKLRLTNEIKKQQVKERNLRGSVSASIELSNLRAKRGKLNIPFSQLTQKQFESYSKTVRDTFMDYKKMATFQKNYVSQMLEVVAWTNNFSSDQLKQIQNKLMNMSPDQFYEFYQRNNALQDILDLYKNITFTNTSDNAFDKLLNGTLDIESLPSGNDDKNSLAKLAIELLD